ncbi:type 1 glutamine amidotransferase [Flavobacterium sp. MK4S-17]|uniref:type 1 glutamine amidotransferase n=1 Tax=Flavobacterium sp. MK4S-17 TaxID=2543737 RepID=UPI001359BFDB|nr:type 1 glutamine amidotransferase [Flavobacterium sp. MK4S-17]
MNVHYFQHVPFEGLGYIETWLKEHRYNISATKFFEADFLLPEISEIDALIVMGGPMSVYDEILFPWLRHEKAFIKLCIQSGKKVLGICLGAQLIAECLEAKVVLAKNKEIGWFPVIPTEECKKIAWLYRLFKYNPVVFHWHGDQFEIPQNSCLNLLYSEANVNQAFYYNQNIIGLQFHLEVTVENLILMIENGKEELFHNSPYIQSKNELLTNNNHILQCNGLMDKILSNWLIA